MNRIAERTIDIPDIRVTTTIPKRKAVQVDRLPQFAITAIAVTVIVCATVLVASGKVVISDDVARGVATLLLGVISGWLGLRRPGDV